MPPFHVFNVSFFRIIDTSLQDAALRRHLKARSCDPGAFTASRKAKRALSAEVQVGPGGPGGNNGQQQQSPPPQEDISSSVAASSTLSADTPHYTEFQKSVPKFFLTGL